jgi:peptidoglycan/LPS O-acetylase OafA/YrhL
MIAVSLPIAATVLGWFRVRLLQRRTGASPTRDHEQLVALDGLRAISIGLVLVTHLVPLGPKELRLNEMTGPMGMSLFFALSGFLIVRTLRADSVAEFVIKRLARILPLAWLYLGVVALLFSLEGPALMASLAFVLNYRTDLMISVTEHLWSLGVETQFYAFVGVLALLGRNALVLVWPCCFAITALRVHDSAMIAVVTHLRGDEVLAGACLGCVSFGERRSGKLSPFLWALAAASWAATSHPSGAWLQYLRPYASMALLAATLWLRPGGLLSALGSAPLRYIARISYALYIVHPLTAQHGWWNEGSILERYILKRPAGLVLTFVAAHLSTAYWEQVWTRAVRRWIARLRARRVSPAVAAGHPAG